ncbi:hypothetical protein NEPTK9_000157 [Candidatus Neptunochlamydia vexilliferae]|uniref:Transposase n=1 Tax=Candidatus Neptunichlamydia vexilliferae TaxID=1651774 RepID=A0ABS0AZA2_9BACT|nr:hypothetical protein [Candidatus Neptunochlamydia vexilliferae]
MIIMRSITPLELTVHSKPEKRSSIYHEGAKPFVWRKREVKGAQLRNTIANLCN